MAFLSIGKILDRWRLPVGFLVAPRANSIWWYRVRCIAVVVDTVSGMSFVPFALLDQCIVIDIITKLARQFVEQRAVAATKLNDVIARSFRIALRVLQRHVA